MTSPIAPWIPVMIGLPGLTLLVILVSRRKLIPSQRFNALAILAVFLLIASAITFTLPFVDVISKVSSGEADDDGSTPLEAR